MSHTDATERVRLPTVWKQAIWHPQSGLLASPSCRTLPLEMVDNATSKNPQDFLKPRLLHDGNVYLACYPRLPIYRSPLFSVLLASNVEIPGTIQEIPGNPPEFIMEESIRNAWSRLERGLMAVAEVLISKHAQAKHFPTLTYPRLPCDYGYESAHKSRDAAVSCAKRARGAFHSLSALTTFSLVLWLTEYEDNCFDKAFSALAAASRDDMPRVWLDLLQNSVVCNLSAGVRPGGFFDAYTTEWGRAISQFCRARVPIWVLWGKDGHERQLADPRMRIEYYPPKRIFDWAVARPVDYERVVMPLLNTYHFDPASAWQEPPAQPFAGNPPLEPQPPASHPPSQTHQASGSTQRLQTNPHTGSVHAGSGQRSGESWMEFEARMEKGLEERKRVESNEEKQRREALETHAQKHGYSKNSSVYIWEQDDSDPTFYRRMLLSKSEAMVNWESFTERQRRFWPHKKQWDLCPQISPFATNESAHAEQARIVDLDNSEDEDYSLLYSKVSVRSQKVQNEWLAEAMLESVRAAVA